MCPIKCTLYTASAGIANLKLVGTDNAYTCMYMLVIVFHGQSYFNINQSGGFKNER